MMLEISSVAGLGRDAHDAGDVGSGVGDELLGAVDHPVAAVERGARLRCRRRCRPRARSGRTRRASRRAQLRQPLALLLLGAEQVDRLRAERRVRAQRDRHARNRPASAPRRPARRPACRRRRRRTPRGTGCPSGPARRACARSRRGRPSCGRAPRRPARPRSRRSRGRGAGSLVVVGEVEVHGGRSLLTRRAPRAHAPRSDAHFMRDPRAGDGANALALVTARGGGARPLAGVAAVPRVRTAVARITVVATHATQPQPVLRLRRPDGGARAPVRARDRLRARTAATSADRPASRAVTTAVRSAGGQLLFDPRRAHRHGDVRADCGVLRPTRPGHGIAGAATRTTAECYQVRIDATAACGLRASAHHGYTGRRDRPRPQRQPGRSLVRPGVRPRRVDDTDRLAAQSRRGAPRRPTSPAAPRPADHAVAIEVDRSCRSRPRALPGPLRRRAAVARTPSIPTPESPAT